MDSPSQSQSPKLPPKGSGLRFRVKVWGYGLGLRFGVRTTSDPPALTTRTSLVVPHSPVSEQLQTFLPPTRDTSGLARHYISFWRWLNSSWDFRALPPPPFPSVRTTSDPPALTTRTSLVFPHSPVSEPLQAFLPPPQDTSGLARHYIYFWRWLNSSSDFRALPPHPFSSVRTTSDPPALTTRTSLVFPHSPVSEPLQASLHPTQDTSGLARHYIPFWRWSS